MRSESATVASLKGHLSKFSEIISKRFKKPKKKLIKKILYGIQASKDVKLSNIGRTLKENQPLIKTEDRLSRNLDDEDFTDSLNEEIYRVGASKITEGVVIAIDPEDLRKKYEKKMEFLGRVRDGNEEEIGDGYPLCKAVTTDIESKNVIPLYSESYHFLAEGVKSENSQVSIFFSVIKIRQRIWQPLFCGIANKHPILHLASTVSILGEDWHFSCTNSSHAS